MASTRRFFEIDTNGGNVRAMQMDDEPWQDAADRAIRRKFGAGASAWGWDSDGRSVNRAGDTIAEFYKATIVGRKSYGSWPVITEARTTPPTKGD